MPISPTISDSPRIRAPVKPPRICIDERTPKRWNWPLAAVALLGLILSAWLLRDWQAQTPQPPTAAALGAPSLRTASAAAPGDGSFPWARTPSSGAAAATPAERDQIEICGYGTIKRAELEAEAGTPRHPLIDRAEADTEAWARKWLARLDSGDAVQQAAAHLARRGKALSDAYAGESTGAAALEQATQPHEDAFLRVYQTTNDPRLAMMAHHFCERRQSAVGVCANQSAADWAKRHPDDAQAWLAVAAEAQRRTDTVALSAALAQIKTDNTWLDHSRLMLQAALEVEPEGMPPIHQSMLVTHLQGSVFMAGLPVQNAYNACRTSDPSCARVIELLAQRATSVTDASVALAMARRQGMRSDRLTDLRGRVDATRAAIALRANDPSVHNPYSCEGVEFINWHLHLIAKSGELNFAHQYALEFGQSFEALARIGRETREAGEARNLAQQAAAQRAASAQNAASKP
jgi:hypothetical protein